MGGGALRRSALSLIGAGVDMILELTADELRQARVALLSRQEKLARDYCLTENRLIERQYRTVFNIIGTLCGPSTANA